MDWQKQWDKSSEKNLVAEQPGWSLAIPALIFALFLGLVIRAIISPNRVKEQIQKAANHIHRDAHINFESAYISLADGIFPELAVVINNVQMNADVRCWMRPTIEIDQMKLPISFVKLMAGELYIDQIVIQEMNLSLADAFKTCESTSAGHEAPQVGETSPRSPAQIANLPLTTKSVIRVPEKSPISKVQIKRLNIHYLPLAFTSFFLDNFLIELENEQPLKLHSESLLRLNRDSLANVGSLAKLKVDYNESGEPILNIDLKGSLGEGSFNTQAQFMPRKRMLNLDGDLKYFPISQIMPLFKKYRVIESDFTGKRTWVSGKLKYEGQIESKLPSPLRLQGLRLEGDIGEISSSSLEITELSPLKFKPFDVEIKSLSLGEVKHLLNLEHPTKIFGSLGYFTGALHIESPDKFNLRGDHMGLEFIFSNRGIRKHQTISLISGELEYSRDLWQAKIDRVRPFEGVFEGELKLRGDKQFHRVEVSSKIAELELAPSIQSLMTGGGYLGSFGGEFKLALKNNEIDELNGNLRWNKMDVDGIRVEKLKAKLAKTNKILTLNLAAQEMELEKQKQATLALNNVFKDLNVDSILLKNPALKISTSEFKELSWSEFSADSVNGKFQSEGGWDGHSSLRGILRINGKNKKKWNIGGFRNNLVIEKDDR